MHLLAERVQQLLELALGVRIHEVVLLQLAIRQLGLAGSRRQLRVASFCSAARCRSLPSAMRCSRPRARS